MSNEHELRAFGKLISAIASGASDIFESLGIDLDHPLERAALSLQNTGICYLPGEAFLKSGWRKGSTRRSAWTSSRFAARQRWSNCATEPSRTTR
ncbi:hypothetical protein [Chlorobaculum tepidum]|uniref:hypothetical protein n=1 Tax=Chlorobaculum tepidum TaxID=1097 RepID=UPI0002E6DB62|nr:hypothetical protein [Chlorobaculum tepidum]